MRFYTIEECEQWLAQRKRLKPDSVSGMKVQRVVYPKEPYRIFVMAQWMSTSLTYREPTLLWITEWGVWPSSENWHLYYKLRQSYADLQLLPEAPGHLFLGHESQDFASFLQLSMLNGWGGYVLTHADYINAVFSHDEYIDFFANLETSLEIVREQFGTAKIGGK